MSIKTDKAGKREVGTNLDTGADSQRSKPEQKESSGARDLYTSAGSGSFGSPLFFASGILLQLLFAAPKSFSPDEVKQFITETTAGRMIPAAQLDELTQSAMVWAKYIKDETALRSTISKWLDDKGIAAFPTTDPTPTLAVNDAEIAAMTAGKDISPDQLSGLKNAISVWVKYVKTPEQLRETIGNWINTVEKNNKDNRAAIQAAGKEERIVIARGDKLPSLVAKPVAAPAPVLTAPVVVAPTVVTVPAAVPVAPAPAPTPAVTRSFGYNEMVNAVKVSAIINTTIRYIDETVRTITIVPSKSNSTEELKAFLFASNKEAEDSGIKKATLVIYVDRAKLSETEAIIEQARKENLIDDNILKSIKVGIHSPQMKPEFSTSVTFALVPQLLTDKVVSKNPDWIHYAILKNSSVTLKNIDITFDKTAAAPQGFGDVHDKLVEWYDLYASTSIDAASFEKESNRLYSVINQMLESLKIAFDADPYEIDRHIAIAQDAAKDVGKKVARLSAASTTAAAAGSLDAAANLLRSEVGLCMSQQDSAQFKNSYISFNAKYTAYDKLQTDKTCNIHKAFIWLKDIIDRKNTMILAIEAGAFTPAYEAYGQWMNEIVKIPGFLPDMDPGYNNPDGVPTIALSMNERKIFADLVIAIGKTELNDLIKRACQSFEFRPLEEIHANMIDIFEYVKTLGTQFDKDYEQTADIRKIDLYYVLVENKRFFYESINNQDPYSAQSSLDLFKAISVMDPTEVQTMERSLAILRKAMRPLIDKAVTETSARQNSLRGRIDQAKEIKDQKKLDEAKANLEIALQALIREGINTGCACFGNVEPIAKLRKAINELKVETTPVATPTPAPTPAVVATPAQAPAPAPAPAPAAVVIQEVNIPLAATTNAKIDALLAHSDFPTDINKIIFKNCAKIAAEKSGLDKLYIDYEAAITLNKDINSYKSLSKAVDSIADMNTKVERLAGPSERFKTALIEFKKQLNTSVIAAAKEYSSVPDMPTDVHVPQTYSAIDSTFGLQGSAEIMTSSAINEFAQKIYDTAKGRTEAAFKAKSISDIESAFSDWEYVYSVLVVNLKINLGSRRDKPVKPVLPAAPVAPAPVVAPATVAPKATVAPVVTKPKPAPAPTPTPEPLKQIVNDFMRADAPVDPSISAPKVGTVAEASEGALVGLLKTNEDRNKKKEAVDAAVVAYQRASESDKETAAKEAVKQWGIYSEAIKEALAGFREGETDKAVLQKIDNAEKKFYKLTYYSITSGNITTIKNKFGSKISQQGTDNFDGINLQMANIIKSSFSDALDREALAYAARNTTLGAQYETYNSIVSALTEQDKEYTKDEVEKVLSALSDQSSISAGVMRRFRDAVKNYIRSKGYADISVEFDRAVSEAFDITDMMRKQMIPAGAAENIQKSFTKKFDNAVDSFFGGLARFDSNELAKSQEAVATAFAEYDKMIVLMGKKVDSASVGRQDILEKADEQKKAIAQLIKNLKATEQSSCTIDLNGNRSYSTRTSSLIDQELLPEIQKALISTSSFIALHPGQELISGVKRRLKAIIINDMIGKLKDGQIVVEIVVGNDLEQIRNKYKACEKEVDAQLGSH